MTSTRTPLAQRLRESSAAEAVRRRLRGPRPEPRWEGVEDLDTAAEALVGWALEAAADRGDRALVVIVGDGGPLHATVEAALQRHGKNVEALAVADVPEWATSRPDDVAIVLCTYADARGITDTAEAVGCHPRLSNVRFEYASGLYQERAAFTRWDEYADTWFISPVL